MRIGRRGWVSSVRFCSAVRGFSICIAARTMHSSIFGNSGLGNGLMIFGTLGNGRFWEGGFGYLCLL